MTVAPELLEASGETEVIVQLGRAPISENMSEEEVRETLKRHAAETQEPIVDYADSHDGVEIQRQFWLTNAVLVTVDTDTVDFQELTMLPGVEELLPNEEVKKATTTTEPTAGESLPSAFDAIGASQPVTATETTYGLGQISAPSVWDRYDARGEGTKVAVLDTGVDPDHTDIDLYTRDPEDLTYPGGWAEFNNFGIRIDGSTPYDDDGHGTHVSGTVAGGNSSGMAIGVAPETDLIHGLVLPEGTGTSMQIIAGFEWALEEDADMISMSLGGPFYRTHYLRAVQNAEAAGTVVVGAAGNFGEGTADAPANVYETVSVGSTDIDETIAPTSGGRIITTEHAWGDRAPDHWPERYLVPDVTAPGVDVFSANTGGGYVAYSGTSMATPHVAGTLALMLSASDGDYSPAELRTALYETTRKPPDAPGEQDVRYGRGIVDALAATERLAGQEPEIEPISPDDDSD